MNSVGVLYQKLQRVAKIKIPTLVVYFCGRDQILCKNANLAYTFLKIKIEILKTWNFKYLVEISKCLEFLYYNQVSL